MGMIERPDRPSLFGTAMLHSSQPVRGIATSGWRGRSFSLGIADAVTVLADRAAVADAAATIIANAVDLPGHPAVVRVPASDLAPDSDLGELLVTQGVGELSAGEIDAALDAGLDVVHSLLSRQLIRAAALRLCDETRILCDDDWITSASSEGEPSAWVIPAAKKSAKGTASAVLPGTPPSLPSL
jgi:hypothetical protein